MKNILVSLLLLSSVTTFSMHHPKKKLPGRRPVVVVQEELPRAQSPRVYTPVKDSHPVITPSVELEKEEVVKVAPRSESYFTWKNVVIVATVSYFALNLLSRGWQNSAARQIGQDFSDLLRYVSPLQVTQ